VSFVEREQKEEVCCW